jgi:hypothetical protein
VSMLVGIWCGAAGSWDPSRYVLSSQDQLPLGEGTPWHEISMLMTAAASATSHRSALQRPPPISPSPSQCQALSCSSQGQMHMAFDGIGWHPALARRSSSSLQLAVCNFCATCFQSEKGSIT